MVGWYNPIQLGRTAKDVLVSTLLGKHNDKRVLQAIADSGELRPKYFYEVNKPADEEFWFDYIADMGDGFNSTYTMAYHITRHELTLKTPENKTEETQKGDILIFGGDEVYPVADWKVYEERLVNLYDLAYRKKTEGQAKDPANHPYPALFAIPGNHDWYDSLVAFMTLFGREKEFCGWECPQNRSYFAIKLPRGWWLFGTDVQLGSSLDQAQMDYFERVVKKHMKPADRIIFCNAEPHWITDTMYEKERGFAEANMGFFEGHILNHQVAVYIAGDRHYYKRHEEIENWDKKIPKDRTWKIQKIVAGGGGAFLHPTHRESDKIVGKRHKFERCSRYPSALTSFLLTFLNLPLLFWNLSLGFVTGALYLLTAQAFLADLGPFSLGRIVDVIPVVGTALVTKPIALFWSLLILIGFFLFTDVNSKIFRVIGGFLHATAHLLAVLVIAWWAADYVGNGRLIAQLTMSELLKMGFWTFLGGFIVGPTILGIYLLLSLNVFGWHHNEAFSGLKIKGYKNFVRFKIDAKGDLTIYPVGVDRVVTNWREGDKKKGEAGLEPTQMESSNKPFLIEGPVKFCKSEMNLLEPKEKEEESKHPQMITKIELDSNANLDA